MDLLKFKSKQDIQRALILYGAGLAESIWVLVQLVHAQKKLIKELQQSSAVAAGKIQEARDLL